MSNSRTERGKGLQGSTPCAFIDGCHGRRGSHFSEVWVLAGCPCMVRYTNGDLKGAVVYEPIMKVEGHMSKMSRELGERSWGAANQGKGQGAREPA